MFKINNLDVKNIGLVSKPSIAKKSVDCPELKYDACLISLMIERNSVLDQLLNAKKYESVDFEIDNQTYEVQYLYSDGQERFFYGQKRDVVAQLN